MSGAERPLFRRESLRGENAAWLGRPAIALGLPVSLSAAVSVAFTAALVSLVAFGSYTRRVDLKGVMLPRSGIVMVSVPANGWIRRLNVVEGQSVQAGALLYTIDVDTTIKDGGTQQAIMHALSAQRAMLVTEIQSKQTIAAETANQLTQTIANLKAQVSQMDDQIATQQTFETRLKGQYTQYLQLSESHTVAANEVNTRQQTWMAAQSALQQLKGNQLRLKGDLINAEYKAATNPAAVENEIGELKNKISEIDQNLASSEAHRSIELRAPGSGIVTAIAAKEGQVVALGSRLLTIVPKQDTMIGQLLAPSAAVGFVQPGERVLLRYSGFPYQKFGQYGGTVESVSRAALNGDDVRPWQTDATRDTPTGPFYLVTVRPDRQSVNALGGEHPIPANMQVNAQILLDSRQIYQWILEPLYSIGRPWHRT
jgi:membrane fusion protein